MDKSLHKAKELANHHLLNKRFNQGLAVLEQYSNDIPEVEYIRQQIKHARVKEIDVLLTKFEQNFEKNNWQQANLVLREIKALDSGDSKVHAAEKRLQKAYVSNQRDEELNKKMQSAKTLLKRPGQTLGDIDSAVSLLEEVVSREPDNLEADSLLDETIRIRADFLKSIGEVATLEQAGEYEDALKEVNDLIARGLTEFKGKDIFDVRGHLERKAQEFADQKAAKYLEKAELELKDNPKLSLKYINIGLGLPAIPKVRREALSELKIKADMFQEKFEKNEKRVQKAGELITNENYEQAIVMLEGTLANLPNHREAKTYLELARQGLKDKVLKKARLLCIRIESSLSKENLQQSKEELLLIIDQLDFHGNEVDSLRSKSYELLKYINNQQQLEKKLELSVLRAREALNLKNFVEAQQEIDCLDKTLQERPEIRKIRSELSRTQDIDNVLHEIRQAVEGGRMDTAWDLVRDLKKRAPKHLDVENQYKHIDATVQFNRGVETFQEGQIQMAGNSFRRVVSLATCHTDDAEKYLQKIETLGAQDQIAKQVYITSQAHVNAGEFQKAYQLLKEHVATPSSVRNEILQLLSRTREKWRNQLSRQIKACLKNSTYDDIPALVDDFKEVREAEDSSLINEALKKHCIYRAEFASEQGNWAQACQYWKESQRYDMTDDHIHKSLRIAIKQKALQSINQAKDDHDLIRTLEGAIEIQVDSLTDLDFKIEDLLYLSYFRTGEFGKALSLAGKRINRDAKFAGKARLVTEVALKLSKSREKFKQGVYKESIDIIKQCQCNYLEYSAVLEELIQLRRRQAIAAILEEALELEQNEESDVRLIKKYKELLHIEPTHKEAKDKYERLRARFNLKVNDIMQESILLRDDANAAYEDIEYLIEDMNEMLTIANPKQKTRLKGILESLRKKAQSARILKKKLNLIEALLATARETGDFDPVDRELNEVFNVVSFKNRDYNRIVSEIHNTKDRRTRCVELAQKLEQAFLVLDFLEIGVIYEEIYRLDEDDEFGIQHTQLRFEDTYTKQEIPFIEMKNWARAKGQNLNNLKAWLEEQNIDTGNLEKIEEQLRAIEPNDIDYYRHLSEGLEKNANIYKNYALQLSSPPTVALSEPANAILKQTEKLKKRLENKAFELHEEAQELLYSDNKIKALLKEAGSFINANKYLQAEPLVEEGLLISPNHAILHHYSKMIKQKR